MAHAPFEPKDAAVGLSFPRSTGLSTKFSRRPRTAPRPEKAKPSAPGARFGDADGCGSKPMVSHFGVGEFTTHVRTYFSGEWDVHWYGALTHGHMAEK